MKYVRFGKFLTILLYQLLPMIKSTYNTFVLTFSVICALYATFNKFAHLCGLSP
ncbi:hypothetical protein [Staphylococcus pseudoxylosus]|uniref:hypothetical protein n=1 Tax=Staphylococcus pseudoxylosus TaxID=2282419 RepID=UPI003F55D52C